MLLLASPHRTQEDGATSGPASCGSWCWPPPFPSIKFPTQEFLQDPEVGPAAF